MAHTKAIHQHTLPERAIRLLNLNRFTILTCNLKPHVLCVVLNKQRIIVFNENLPPQMQLAGIFHGMGHILCEHNFIEKVCYIDDFSEYEIEANMKIMDWLNNFVTK